MEAHMSVDILEQHLRGIEVRKDLIWLEGWIPYRDLTFIIIFSFSYLICDIHLCDDQLATAVAKTPENI